MNNYPGNPAQFQSFFILFLTIIFLRFHQKWDWLGYTSSLLKVTYLSMALSPNLVIWMSLSFPCLLGIFYRKTQ